MTSCDLAGFLRARLDEDEAAAKAPSPSGLRLRWRASADLPDEDDEDQAPRHWVLSDPNLSAAAAALGLERETGRAVAAHIARHDPARVLREVEAGRKLLRLHEQAAEVAEPIVVQVIEGIMRDRAAVWSDHPDFDPAWAVSP